FAQHYNGRSIINKSEYGSRFYSKTANGKTTYSYVQPNGGSSGMVGIPGIASIPAGTTKAGDVHTHGTDGKEKIVGERDDDNVPSGQDIEDGKESGLPTYVVTPSGKLIKIDPKTGKTSEVPADIPSDPASGSKRVNIIDPELAPYI